MNVRETSRETSRGVSGGTIVCAVLIADLAGFSALCEREGIERGRAEAHRFWALGRHYAAENGGTFVKGFSDDFAAVFPTVAQAERAARAVMAAIPSSAGIGYGEVLLEDGDLWGVEVNRASRLGEDVAGEGEVLLTEGALYRCAVRRPMARNRSAR